MWQKITKSMPKKNEYVLVYTPFCKYKCAVAFWNGTNWRSADNKTEVWNIKHWMQLPSIKGL